MNPKNNHTDAALIATLRAHLSPKEPPMGYEEKLLTSLRIKLPIEKSLEATVPKRQRSWGFHFLGLAEGVALCSLVVLGLWYFKANKMNAPSSQSLGDMLAQVALSGESDDVNRWLASMGDATGLRQVARNDVTTLWAELNRQKDLEKVLQDAAKRLQDSTLSN